jgi:F0F1-type ATP synthase membrane subunit b/b'
MSESFKKIIEARVQDRIQLKDFVSLALDDQTQPLTIAELTVLINRELNRNYDNSTIRTIMHELVYENRAVVRTETIAERNLRSEGRSVPGTPSTIYFSSLAGVQTPPKRTIAIVVPGTELRSTFGRRPKAKRRGRPPGAKNRPKIQAPVKSAEASSTVELLIEQLVKERTREIQAKLDEANAKLDKLKSLLRS